MGKRPFLLWLGSYAACAAPVVWLRPRWLTPLALAGAIVWSASVAGPLAVLAALLVLALGLPGLAVLITAMSLTIALPIHYPLLYWIVVPAAVFLLRRRMRLPSWPNLSRMEAAAAALLIFALLSNWLMALKPEISADGLAMHLVIPARVALDHRWSFDVARFTWAVMPMGGDWAYTAAYLMGGEAAARILNFGLLAWMAFSILRLLARWATLTRALLLTAVFVSSPLVTMATGSMFVENFWGALVVGALSAVFDRRFLIAALLLGAAVASKLGALPFAAAILVLLAVETLREPGFPWVRTVAASFAIFFVLAAIPYGTAWAVTGNPVFPFLNTTFQSPLYDTSVPFQDNRYRTPA
ncbi:MAG TPA: hypothetical protein DEH78_15205, partial [Solibacterales bacterium]|nr:hypothetical protein [Bryobacterales bacterium]